MTKLSNRNIKKYIYHYRYFYLMLLPGLAFLFLFKYGPLYGIQLAFKEYRIVGIAESNWVGLDNFKYLLSEPEFWRAFKNTLIISFMKILIGFPFPILLAIAFSEFHYNRPKKLFQILYTFPHFLSLCFALATGVGKTRLMGACIYYLYKTKGYRNFFILSPNITIYEKLRAELLPSHPKYMFTGIPDMGYPLVYSGDDYLRFNTDRILFDDEFNIFLFNRSKIFKRGDADFRFHRFNEYLGASFSVILREMDDLVVLMDESHRYRAPASLSAINHLSPALGLEFTATPKTEENVFYSFPLAEAIGRYVKTPLYPTVATRSNLTTSDTQEIERLKLIDGLTLHEIKKGRLAEYCYANNLPEVKPFVLISTKDTTHAGEIRKLIESEEFFEGRYREKVIEIHSAQKGEESDENINRLLSVENVNSTVEIVIHVSMLKEGWDVKNLYTIIPLRASISEILTEQTIGRGLRLHFGSVTGDPDLDALEIISHDNYAKLIDAARTNPLFKTRDLDREDTRPRHTVKVQRKFIDTEEVLDKMREMEFSLYASHYTEQEKIDEVVAQLVERDMRDFETPQKNSGSSTGSLPFQQIGLFPETEKDVVTTPDPKVLTKRYTQRITDYARLTIDVPRITVEPNPQLIITPFEASVNIGPFELVSQNIIEHNLSTGKEREKGEVELLAVDDPVKFIAGRLIDEVDEFAAEEDAELVLKLSREYTKKMVNEKGVNPADLGKIVHLYRKSILNDLTKQIESHIEESDEMEIYTGKYPVRFPTEYSKTVYNERGIIPYTEQVKPTDIRGYLFEGYEKCIYPQIPFDSVPEKEFSTILEKDDEVIKWVRPPEGSLPLRVKGHSYTPDFIVETATEKYLVEIKGIRDLEPVIKEDVKEKATAATRWTEIATEQIKGKSWSYALIPENRVSGTSDFRFIMGQRIRA